MSLASEVIARVDAADALDLRRETRNARPLFDASALTPHERSLAAESWKGRMVSEYVSARVFAALVPQAMAAGLPYDHVSRLSEMISQEVEHAELCARVIRSLGDEPVSALPTELVAVPPHEDATPLEGLLRNVLSVSCCSETVAVALVGAERELAATPELSRLLSSILADEVNHSRFGWRLLAEVAPRLDAQLRARLSAYLVVAFRHQLAFHAPFLTMPETTPHAIGVGAPDGKMNFRIFVETVESVIVPRLSSAGLDASRAWSQALASA